MAGKTDFGAPKKRAKAGAKPGEVAVKLKAAGKPSEVHKVLDRMGMAGAGDMKAPGPRGPRHLHPTPAAMTAKRVPALAKPLGQMKGKKPTLTARSMGVGDPPAALTGGTQPIVDTTRITVYKRPKKAAAKVASGNPEAPKRGRHSGGAKKAKGDGKALNPVMLLKFPEEPAPPRIGREREPVSDRMPPEAEPRRAPKPDLTPLDLGRRRGGGRAAPVRPEREARRPQERPLPEEEEGPMDVMQSRTPRR